MFIHLRVHTSYSLSESAIKIPQLLEFCQSSVMPACAITDSNNLFGAMEFCLSAIKAGVQPLIGVKIMVASPFAKENKLHTEQTEYYPLIFLATSQNGYKNLSRIISRAYLSNNHIIHTTLQQLKELNDGLIVLTGGMEGEIVKHLHYQNVTKFQQYLAILQSIYPNNLYIELQRLEEAPNPYIEEKLLTYAQENNIPIVATNTAYFIHKEQYEAHDALFCIAKGRYVNDPKRIRFTPEYRLKTPQEMLELFKDLPEAVNNTLNIAKRCNFILSPAKVILPHFPAAQDEKTFLNEQAHTGLANRLETKVFTSNHTLEEKEVLHKKYFDRLNFELNVIHKMGYAGYFLIVAEFIEWAKKNNIPVGPGRGSGGGSLVAWSLTITNIDPIHFELIFERFLNPERVSMPDFDIDFCPERREEVIEHVCEQYGSNKVAQIITFGKLQARAVVRDVGRVMGLPYMQVDKISKMIPSNPNNPITLQEAIQQDPGFTELIANNAEIKKLIDIALQLEGLYRHASTHAAGIVIGSKPLEDIVPLYKDSKSNLPATQFNMKYVELAGLVKFDFLGLKTLTIIQTTIKLIKQQKKIILDIDNIPFDDKKTFTQLRKCATVGVFQLESAGMKDVLFKLQPTQLSEIIALVALYRPGPMDDIPRYIACKNKTQAVTYVHPKLEKILQETYGVIVYQEQVMQIAQQLAGYSLGQADLLRRAMGKKIKKEMDAQRENFVNGCIEISSMQSSVASELFDQITKFASYAFPKGHAVPYGIIAYQTAYLKANYPEEFLAALMTHDIHNTDKLGIIREELRRLNIPLLGPDINKSFATFSLDLNTEQTICIRYALCGLKNIGEGAVELLVKERKKNGPYKTILDFIRRLDSKALNKRMLENLICSGAVDSLYTNRAQLFNSVNLLMKYLDEKNKQTKSLQESLFSQDNCLEISDISLPNTKQWNNLEQAQYEFESIGFYLSGHPVESYKKTLAKHDVVLYSGLQEIVITQKTTTQNLAGTIVSTKERISKNDKKFAFIQIADPSGLFEGIVFNDTYMRYRDIFTPGAIVLLNVTAKHDGDSIRLVVNSVQLLNQQEAHNDVVEIDIQQEEDLKKALTIKKPYKKINLNIVDGGLITKMTCQLS